MSKKRQNQKPAVSPRVNLSTPLTQLDDRNDPLKVGIGARLRNYLLTGLVVVGPVTLTLYIAWSVIKMVDGFVKPYIPSIYNPDTYLPFALPGVGILAAIVALMMIGALAANLIGRSLITAGEMMLSHTPLVRNLYRGTKQIFESVVTVSSLEKAYQKVGITEFPSKGIWALVFMTGDADPKICAIAPDEELISVFMPTQIIPPSGFVVFVPRRNVIPVDLSVEDAAKIIISAGLVNPSVQSKLNQLATTSRPRTGRNKAVEKAPEKASDKSPGKAPETVT